MFAFRSVAALMLALAAPAAAFDRIQEVDPNTVAAPGLDGIHYVDPEIAAPNVPDDELIDTSSPGAAADLLAAMHPIYTELRRGLLQYRADYGQLPQVQIPEGPALRRGASGERVALLRERLGLAAGSRYDDALVAKVRGWQRTHGLAANGVADADTIASLNRGHEHYERVILANLERARRLPSHLSRYILVDSGAARLWLYEDNRAIDTMKVVVGTIRTPTPLMAGLIRFAELNPVWNVPTEFVRDRMAPRVLSEGLSYLESRGYQILSDNSDQAHPVDPATIDWQAVAEGRLEPRVMQRPSAANSMGEVKFMMPNALGIYLHDTPDKTVFERDDRWISNGCVRLEDAPRLAAWLFNGAMPEAGPRDTAQRVDLPEPMPLFLAYLTVGTADDGGIVFRRDVYDRDPAMIARMFGARPEVETAAREDAAPIQN